MTMTRKNPRSIEQNCVFLQRGSSHPGPGMDQESQKLEDLFLPDLREGGLSGVFPRIFPYLLAGWSHLLHHSLIFN